MLLIDYLEVRIAKKVGLSDWKQTWKVLWIPNFQNNEETRLSQSHHLKESSLGAFISLKLRGLHAHLPKSDFGLA